MYDGTKEYQFLDHWFRRHISYCMGHKDINRESKIVVSEIFYTFFCILVDLIYKVKALCLDSTNFADDNGRCVVD